MRASEFIKANGGAWPDAYSKPSLMQRVVSFASAVASGFADDAEYQRRLDTCGTCARVERDGDAMYCKACGCGKWRLSEMKTKLKFQQLRCPEKKW